jgi:hypothetical protein
MFMPKPYLDFYLSQIPDPTIDTKEEGQKIWYSIFFCSHKYHKIENDLFLNRYRKKYEPIQSQRIILLFSQNIVTKLSKIWVLVPGSEIRDPGSAKILFQIPDTGFKKAQYPY